MRGFPEVERGSGVDDGVDELLGSAGSFRLFLRPIHRSTARFISVFFTCFFVLRLCPHVLREARDLSETMGKPGTL